MAALPPELSLSALQGRSLYTTDRPAQVIFAVLSKLSTEECRISWTVDFSTLT